MNKLLWTLTALVLAAVIASPAAAQFGGRFNTVVRGEVHWSGPLPVDSTLQVFVFDLTDPARPQIIADQAIKNLVGSPVPFQIPVDPQRIGPTRTYGVMARIIYGNPPVVAYEERQPHYVLTKGNPNTVSVRLSNLVSNPGSAVVRGEVAWSGPPPVGSILQVFVFDLTNPQYPEIVADQAINNVLGSPVSFQIAVDPRRIVPSHTYGVMARIIYGNPPSVAYEERQPHYVLTKGNPNTVRLRLDNLLGNPGRPGRPGQGFRRGRIDGTVTFRDRAVPDGSILQVFLFDMTDPRAPFIIADQAIDNPQGSEAQFRLRFDRSRIDRSRRYALQARIIYGNPPSVLLRTPRPVFVFTRGNDDDDDNIELRLRRVN